MDHQFDFDRLAKELAAGLSRREALRRLGQGVANALLAAVGLAPAAEAQTCPTGQLRCFGVCVDPKSDPKNCGACGAACNNTHLCCNGVCKNPSNDKSNCGACGKVCAAGQFCCFGQCVNPQTDPNHCGACLQKCLPGQSCVNGMCLCPAGQVLCYGRCTDRSTDENNCGGCGIRCPAGQVCQNGQCRPCPSGTTLCSGSKGRACCSSTQPICCDGICCAAGQYCCNNTCSICPCDKTFCTGSKGTNCCEAGRSCADGVCCVPAGSSIICSGDSDCCAGSTCVGNQCVRPSGSTCQNDVECRLLRCTSGVCCLPAGSGIACSSNSDCCAGSTCVENVCVKPSGSTCQMDEECRLLRCTSGVCCLAAGSGIACSSNNDCCAGSTCVDNVCVKPSGSTCQMDEECRLLRCTSGVCCLPAGSGIACGSNSDCCAGSTCVNSRCI